MPISSDTLQLHEDVPTAKREAVDKHGPNSLQNVDGVVSLGKEGGHLTLDLIEANVAELLQGEEALKL